MYKLASSLDTNYKKNIIIEFSNKNENKTATPVRKEIIVDNWSNPFRILSVLFYAAVNNMSLPSLNKSVVTYL